MFSFESIQKNDTSSPGIFIGVVEDDLDPNKAGRVRVRILGIHSENKSSSTENSGIPTNELPWAIPATPLFEGGTSGLGIFSVPVKGSWVTLFFIGEDHNYPVYFACIAGNPKTKPDSSKGFSDPSGKYPLVEEEPDWNRNARNDGIGVLIKDTKDAARLSGILQTKADSWDEPESSYAAEYPYNSVTETRDSGIIVECDSTPNAERYHIYHKKSGNYWEISSDGTTVYRSKGNNFEINISDKNIVIKQNANTSITGDKDLKVEGDINTSVDGNAERLVGGNVTENIQGKLTINVMGGEANISADKINLVGGAGVLIPTSGVVTGECLCAFTGSGHFDYSTKVFATKI